MLENAEPIAAQRIYCSPSSTPSGLKFWRTQEIKIYEIRGSKLGSASLEASDHF